MTDKSETNSEIRRDFKEPMTLTVKDALERELEDNNIRINYLYEDIERYDKLLDKTNKEITALHAYCLDIRKALEILSNA